MDVYPRPANVIPSCAGANVLRRDKSFEHLVLGFVHGFRPANYAVGTEILDTGLLCEDIMVRLQAQLQRSLPGKAKGQLKV
jgi:hypothetical protein